MELLKLLSTNEIIAQVLNFLLLFFLLKVFAWKHLLKLLDDRKARIADEFKKIEDAQTEITSLRKEYDSKLSSIDDAARERIHQAVEEGRKITEEIKKNAHIKAQDIIEQAKQNIHFELTKAKEELKDKIVDLTIQATESVIKEKLTEETDKKLVADFLDKIDQAE